MLLSHEIAREIEDQLEYPGQVKVTVIRESRAIDVARNVSNGGSPAEALAPRRSRCRRSSPTRLRKATVRFASAAAAPSVMKTTPEP